MRKTLAILSLILITGCSQKMEKNTSENFDFSCPSSPNCVSSLAGDEDHKIEPLKYTGSANDAMDRLEKILNGMKRSKILLKDDNKIHAVFTSFLFRFKDDVYFQVNDAEKKIDIKSASRVGYSDLGVNKKRVEEIRSVF